MGKKKLSKATSPQCGPARGHSRFLFFPPFAGGPDPEWSSNSNGSGWLHAFRTKLVPSLQLLLFSRLFTQVIPWGAIFVSSQIPMTEYHFF